MENVQAVVDMEMDALQYANKTVLMQKHLIESSIRCFFIDETEKLWTVLKDGRVRFVRSVPAFTNISANYHTLSGVEFDGEQTVVLSCAFNFSEEEFKKSNTISSPSAP